MTKAMRVAAAETIDSRPSALPRRLSFDEAAHRKGSGNLATIVSDLDRKRVHEVLDGRSKRVLERYLGSLSEEQRAVVQVVCIDLYDPYRQAVRAELPSARIVADPFHVERGAGEALDTVRRARQRQARATVKGKYGRRATWNPRIYRARHLLLRGRERLSEPQRRRLCDLFAYDPVIAEAWWLKEEMRSVYSAENRDQAERRLDRFFAAARRSGYQPFNAYANGIEPWREKSSPTTTSRPQMATPRV